MLNSRKTRSLFFTICLLFISGTGYAELYKWKDDDGIWHFSSLPPSPDVSFDTFDTPVEQKPMVTVRKLGLEREPEYSFFNNIWGPVEVSLELHDVENVRSEPPLPASFVIPGQTEKRLLLVKAIDPGESFSFRLSYNQMIGPRLSELPSEVDYYPPFPAGMEFPISQGFDNDITHSEPPNQYAVDIVMPIGTPILAARAGKVMDMEDNFRGGAKEKRYLTRSNLVRILHDDGTMSVYAHLQPNSIQVRRGGEVKRGQWIANSGNTGYSSGPHLHFVVQLNVGMALESLPFRFITPNGSTMTPAKQTMIRGVLAK